MPPDMIGSSMVSLSTWAEVVFAARQGLIDERTHVELKKGLPPSSQNEEVACDLASLAVEGGLLIYGVADAGAGKAGEVVGIDNAESAKVRLVAVAHGLVTPSLVCDVRVVPDPSDGVRGCVVVTVPPSATAPHRARERYWGRSAEGKRVLSDAEVQYLFATRRSAPDGLENHIRSLSGSFDPVPEHLNGHGHLYVLASPRQPSAAIRPWDRGDQVQRVVFEARMPQSGWGGATLQSLNYSEAHPDGIMAVSRHLAELKSGDEDGLIRALLRDDGHIDVAFGLGTRTHQAHNERPTTVVMLGAVITHVDQVVRLAAHVAQRKGYQGTWRFGVLMTKLRGAVAIDTFNDHFDKAHPYPTDEYLRFTDATTAETLERPQDVVERLMAGLDRGLGYQGVHVPYTSPEEVFRRR